MRDGTEQTKRELHEPLYWIAIHGPAVPSWPLPTPAAMMRKATVWVGERGEQTLWLFPGSCTAAEGMTPELPELQSNYDVLIGYRTRKQQIAAVSLLLTAPIEMARAEVRRAAAAGSVIRRLPAA
jgi:hypothetical protein